MFIAQLFFRQFQHITRNLEGLLIKYVKLKFHLIKLNIWLLICMAKK